MKPFFSLAILLLSLSVVSAEPLAAKGQLLLSDDFSDPPSEWKEKRTLTGGWEQRLSFGDWKAMKKKGVQASNVPDQGHGPVLTYWGTIDDVIIECEFRLPTEDVPDRHFRIFLDHPDYGGHTIAAWANLSTVFQPLGLTLLHNPKKKDKTVLEEARFGPEAVILTPGTWHKMRLELVADQVRVTVGETTVTARHPSLKTTKHKIGLNPGKAGGDLRNFRVWKAIPSTK